MVRKRPAKRRKAATSPSSPSVDTRPRANVQQQQQQQQQRPATATRHSSDDGTMSARLTSSNARTPMTIVVDTDDDEGLAEEPAVNTATTSEPDSDYSESERYTPSVYPRSLYPQPTAQHRTERPFTDLDVQYEGSDRAASTRSLWEQDLDYREIHGRRYCRDYHMPNDEHEQSRLYLLHQVFLHVFDGELTTVPLQDPKHILDVGTGVGEWAIMMAEMFPKCEVVGTDISAIAETQSVPFNVFFEVEDAQDWDRSPDFYDLIHFRYMDGAFSDWRRVYENSFHSLKPGGWIEVQDFDLGPGLGSFMASFAPDSQLHVLHRDFLTACEHAGRGRSVVEHLNADLFGSVGFVDVNESEYIIPVSPNDAAASKFWLIAMVDAVEATYLRFLTTYMGWDPLECKAACESAAKDLANLAKDPERSRGMYVRLVSFRGRKPLEAPLALGTPQRDVTYSPSAEVEGKKTESSPFHEQDPS